MNNYLNEELHLIWKGTSLTLRGVRVRNGVTIHGNHYNSVEEAAAGEGYKLTYLYNKLRSLDPDFVINKEPRKSRNKK